MHGKVAMITGALSGIGRATAVALARRGASVVVSGRHDVNGAALVAELEATGVTASYCRCDVREDTEIAALVDHAVAKFGRLDIAVNNAGTNGESLPITEHTPDTYADVFDVNVRAMLLAMKYEMLAMQQSGGGSIVNLSSTMAFRGRPNLGLYCASKHAVEGLTKVGAIEGAAMNIRVNAIAPGQIDTPMLDAVAGSIPGGKDHIAAGPPMKRLGTSEEAAELILFLAYMDYKNKQLRTKDINPVFGIIDALNNVPKSHLQGFEIEANIAPTRGLNIGLAATYIKSEIDEYTGINSAGVVADFEGTLMPFTPEWQLGGNIRYEASLTDAVSGFIATQFNHRSETFAAIGGTKNSQNNLAPGFEINEYFTVDGQVGVRSDAGWRAIVWGKNLTNTYYWTNVVAGQDQVVRYAARPATYGVTIGFDF